MIYTSSLLIQLLATLESIINCDQGNVHPKELLDDGDKYHSDETTQLLSLPQECIPNITKTECRDIPYSIEASTINSPITSMTSPDIESLDILEADLYVNCILRIEIYLTPSEATNYISTEYTLSRRCSTRAGIFPGHRALINQLPTSAYNFQCGRWQQPHPPIYSTCGNLFTPVHGP